MTDQIPQGSVNHPTVSRQNGAKKIILWIIGIIYILLAGFYLWQASLFASTSKTVMIDIGTDGKIEATQMGWPFMSQAEYGEFGNKVFLGGMLGNFLLWILVLYGIPLVTIFLIRKSNRKNSQVRNA